MFEEEEAVRTANRAAWKLPTANPRSGDVGNWIYNFLWLKLYDIYMIWTFGF